MSNKSKSFDIISTIQINLHKSIAATSTLVKKSLKFKHFIHLIQEPWTRGNSVLGMKGFGKLYHCTSGSTRPRACVLASDSLIVWPLTSFQTQDIAAVEVRLQSMVIVYASVYMAHERACPPVELQKLVDYSTSNGFPIIIGSDANAHHTMWGSTDINDRGEDLLEFMIQNNLTTVNKGHKPTFVTKNRQERLDVTLVNNQSLSLLQKWYVDDDESFSDHRYVRFEVDVQVSTPILTYRNRNKINWEAYDQALNVNLASLEVAEIATTEALEAAVNNVTSAIQNSFYAACPLRHRRINGRCVSWWTDELTIMRKEARKLLRKVTVGVQDAHYEAYKSIKNAYKASIQKAKRNAWQQYCGGITKYSESSRLYRVVNTDALNKLSIVEKPNGVFTKNPSETLDALLEKCFPCENGQQSCKENYDYSYASEAEGVVSSSSVKRAINSFGAMKAAGPDEIHPALLQRGLEYLTPLLVNIYRACLCLGYNPISWRRVKVVFLPKPGRGSYEKLSSWRPISLMSFLLKTLERLIDWHIRTPTLIKKLKANGQFAYMQGASTESALHQVVARMEKTLKTQEFGIFLVLDVEGAFDNTSFELIKRSLYKHGVDKMSARWISSMLCERTVTASLDSVTRNRKVQKGCPQGGVLSPILWNLVVDELLTLIASKHPEIFKSGFADDLGFYATGKDLSTVSGQIQSLIKTAELWSKTVGLGIDQKAGAMLLTLKKNYKVPKLLLNGSQLTLTPSLKYLGITIDARLTWVDHIKLKAQKALAGLFQCRRAVAQKWGLSPRITNWVYSSVIQPGFLYGALVWLPAASNSSKLSRLERVQRCALRMVCGCMKSTPLAGMEAILNCLPIKQQIYQKALSTMHRLLVNDNWLRWNNVGSTRMQTHVDICDKLSRTVPEFYYPCIGYSESLPKEKHFEVVIRSRTEWCAEGMPLCQEGDIFCFTDASKQGDCTGAAFITSQGDAQKFPLGSLATVFQAEALAVLELTDFLNGKSLEGYAISIFIDNLSLIQSLQSSWKVDKLVLECFDYLRKLSVENTVKLFWIPAHSGFVGNEKADELAREAAKLSFEGPEPFVPVTIDAIRQKIKSWTRKEHAKAWKSCSGCSNTKLYIATPNDATGKQCLRLPRSSLRPLIQLISGHCSLNKHLYVMGLLDSPVCKLCNKEPETSRHFVCECEALCVPRTLFLGAPFLVVEDLKQLKLSDLSIFIRKSGRFGFSAPYENPQFSS